jgi:7-cyano-7-deazaguanine synthase
MKTALVVLSGGQDSVTCLGVAMASHDLVHCISFKYGQKHEIELECALNICNDRAISLKVVDLSFLAQLVTSALTSDGDVNQPHEYKTNLPASFVPNRNALFLTVAHAYAQEVGASTIYTGVCQTDYSGYPDCRDEFIQALQYTLNSGYLTDIVIKTPLMFKTKAETFALADEYGILDSVIEDSHTCYNGNRDTLHAWGFGCGECCACKLRAKGWEEFCNAN